MYREYPEPEGYRAPNGAPYPLLPKGEIRKELQHFLHELKVACHEKGYWLEIHSLNTGEHSPNSMHYRGLAVDFDLKERDWIGIYDWMDMVKERDFVRQVAEKFVDDIWIYKETDHLHVSIHPKEEIGWTVTP